jgi:branched-chain amino acid transport system permease protein
MLLDIIQVLLFGLTIGAIYALVAVGLNLIFGVMNVLNVAHGDIAMLGAYLTYWFLVLFNVNPLISLLLIIAIFIPLGAAIYILLIRKIIHISSSVEEIIFSSLIIFFGLSIFIESSALLAWKADFRSIIYFEGMINLGGILLSEKTFIALLVALIGVFSFEVFLTRTYIGKAIRAISQNRVAAILMGIPVDRINTLSFGIGISLAGVGGVLLALIYPIYPALGVTWTMRGLTVCILGGLGSFTGALTGAFVMGIVESFGSYFIGTAWRDVISYLMLLLVLVLKPSGMFGKGV